MYFSLISTLSARYSYASARLLKYFSLIIRFASSKHAHRIFVEHFFHDWLFTRSILFSLLTYTHIHIHTHTCTSSCILLLFTSLFTAPGIFQISSILIQSHDFLSGNPSPRDGFAQYHLLTYDLTNLSRTCPLVPLRFQFRPQGRYPPDCCCAIRFKGAPTRKETTCGGGWDEFPSRFRENLKIRI